MFKSYTSKDNVYLQSYTSNDNLLLPPCLGDFIPGTIRSGLFTKGCAEDIIEQINGTKMEVNATLP